MSGIHLSQTDFAKISYFMFNECFVYRRWRKQNRRTNLTRNRNVFLDFQTCLSLKQGRSLHSIVNMINHDLSHMLPRLEELLNLQILPSHVTESDTIHLRKIATPKCLFFQQYYLSYFCLPREVQAVCIQMSWDHLRCMSSPSFKAVWSDVLSPAWHRSEFNASCSHFRRHLHAWLRLWRKTTSPNK